MTRVIIWLTILLFVSACADSEHMTQYYQLEQARTDALIESMQMQNVELAKSRTLAMTSYTTAISRASVTPSPSDDVAIALAWGYYMGAPQQVKVPNLQPVKAPPTNVEYIRAWSPIIGMAIPLLWGAVWSGNNSGSGGNSYAADNGGSIVLDSGNPGSYNSVGNNYDFQNAQSDYSLINNNSCPDGECDADYADDVGIEDVDQCTEFPDGLACADCSCSSYAAGECSCPTLY